MRSVHFVTCIINIIIKTEAAPYYNQTNSSNQRKECLACESMLDLLTKTKANLLIMSDNIIFGKHFISFPIIIVRVLLYT